MSLELWYWPGIPGRGEFIRVALEAAGVAYRDIGLEQGAEAISKDIAARKSFAPFAPPYLVDGDFVIGQVAHILAYLADKHGFGAGDFQTDMHLIQLQLTITDIVAEVHDTHHPISFMEYYEDQKDAAARRAEFFREERIPKFLGHFEEACTVNSGPFMLGDTWSHVDTSLLVLIDGLRYAFPQRMKALSGDYPRLETLRDAVADLEGVNAYRRSNRCQPFNQDGIFRHYPELDAP